MTVLLKKTDQTSQAIPIELSDKRHILDEKENEAIHETLLRFAEKFSRHIRLNFIESTINAYHNKRGKITNFEIHLQVYPVRGKVFATEVADKRLMNAVHNAIKKIKHQSSHNH